MRRAVVIFAFLAAMAQQMVPASATGGFECTADDKNFQFAASAVVGRGLVTGLMNFQSTAEFRWPEVPKDLRKTNLTDTLKQSWWLGDDLRLHFYFERETIEPFASVELLVMTKLDSDEETYSGTYALTYYEVADPEPKLLKIEGKVVCSAE